MKNIIKYFVKIKLNKYFCMNRNIRRAVYPLKIIKNYHFRSKVILVPTNRSVFLNYNQFKKRIDRYQN